MTSILDLPDEILLNVLEILKAFSAHWVLNNAYELFPRLTLVNKRFCRLVQPSIWRIIWISSISKLTKFHLALQTTPELGRSVEDFQFTYNGGYHKDIDPWGRKILMHGEELYLLDALAAILKALGCLHKLRLNSYSVKGKLPRWCFELPCANTLRELRIKGFLYSPANLDQILLSHKQLQLLVLQDGVADEEWSSSVSSSRNALEKFDLQENYIQLVDSQERSKSDLPIRIYRDIFSHFTAMKELKLYVAPGVFQGSEFDLILMELSQRSQLRAFELRVDRVEEDEDSKLGIDFSTWKYLETLKLDSVAIWPHDNSWNTRNDLYRRLPASLKHLNIIFPVVLGIRTSSGNTDGVLQLNPWYRNRDSKYFNQNIPESRYTWLLNLIKARHDGEPYLPNLQSVNLEETEDYPCEPPFFTNPLLYTLPQDMAVKFANRRIKISIQVRNHEGDP